MAARLDVARENARQPPGESSKGQSVARLGVALLILTAIAAADWRTAAADEPEARSEPDAGGYAAQVWWPEGGGGRLPQRAEFDDLDGRFGFLNGSGEFDTKGHPFFEPIGGNGRACVTCHQPSAAMSLSLDTIRGRWKAAGSKDPMFAAFDGSNCPNLPQDDIGSHSLLLNRGVFRIALPWPPRDDHYGHAVVPEFSIEVVRDPTGCNTDRKFGLKSNAPTISVFRRPRPLINLGFVTAPPFQQLNIKTGMPTLRDPETGQRSSMQLMADNREPSLKSQARNAVLGHLQGQPVDDAVLEKIVDFERNLYGAQLFASKGGKLDELPGLGPDALMNGVPKNGKSTANGFNADARLFYSMEDWRRSDGSSQGDFRASVARGYDVFFLRPFFLRNMVGVNNVGMGNPYKSTCAFCHNTTLTAMDRVPGWMDIGSVNLPAADPAPDLPVFKITCRRDVDPHPYLGRVIYTHDPGRALITGRCVDVGAINIQQFRGLAARAPYFSDGSARTLSDLVDFYDRRFDIGLTPQDKLDLANFLSVL